MDCSIIIVGLLIVALSWDVFYFLRCAFTFGFGMFCQKKRKITDTTTLYNICLSQDVDVFIRHMNNARYIREMDFGRFHFYAVTQLYRAIRQMRGSPVLGATSIRYRRTIPIFSLYKTETKIIWWDEKSIYLEQKFITMDNFVRAIATCKQTIANLNVLELMKKFPGGAEPPKIPMDLKLWLDSNEISSANLRKDK